MINKINDSLLPVPGKKPEQKTPDSKANFSETLKSAIQSINELQTESKDATEAFIRGDISDLHQVMIAAEKARIGLELMMEIRNKLVEGYQEIMRMQI